MRVCWALGLCGFENLGCRVGTSGLYGFKLFYFTLVFEVQGLRGFRG